MSFMTGKQENRKTENTNWEKLKGVQKETHDNKWGFGALRICNKEPRFLPPCIPPRSASLNDKYNKIFNCDQFHTVKGKKKNNTYDFSTALGLYCFAIWWDIIFFSPKGVWGSTNSSGFSSSPPRLTVFFSLFFWLFDACCAWHKIEQTNHYTQSSYASIIIH